VIADVRAWTQRRAEMFSTKRPWANVLNIVLDSPLATSRKYDGNFPRDVNCGVRDTDGKQRTLSIINGVSNSQFVRNFEGRANRTN